MSTQQERAGASLQLGLVRYLYTGYFLLGCAAAFLATNIVDMAWGEGHDKVTNPAGVLVGVVAVVVSYRNERLRKIAMECIEELAEVTWPTRQETYSATMIVLSTSITASVLVFLMDQFWQWVTQVVYGLN